ALGGDAVADRPDIERGVRPGRLREILDDAGDVVVAFDEKDVAGLERCTQRPGVARRERLVADRRLLQVMRDDAPDPLDDDAHDVHPGVSPATPSGTPPSRAIRTRSSCS